MDHEEPGNPDLTYTPPLLPQQQWEKFCGAYVVHTGNEYFPTEMAAYVQALLGNTIGSKQWKAWLQWVAVYKLTGDGRGSFAAGEG